MVLAKDIVDILAKEKLLVYFLLLWAGTFFFWAIHGLWIYGLNVEGAADVLAIIANLMDLLVGVVLALLALKLLKSGFLGTLLKEKLLVYFLLLWAGSFFFWALSDIAYYGPYASRYGEDAMAVIAALFELAVGAVLALLGWRLMATKKTEAQPYFPPPPPLPQS